MARRKSRRPRGSAQASPASAVVSPLAAPANAGAPAATQSAPTRRKKWLLRGALIVGGPLVFLVACEVILRLVGFGNPTGFLLTASVNDQPSWIANTRFGERFFGASFARQPAVFAVPQAKPAETVRIFVFGESAAFGDPQPEFGLPRILGALLSTRYPNTQFEVINAAMTGINSHAVRAIADDCAAADGDLWVIYMGNNEVVGPFGAGTVFGPQTPSSAIIRSSLAIKSTRFGQLLGQLSHAVNPPPASKSQWGGMLMFIENQLRSDDARMARVYQYFADNLRHILDAADAAGVGVVLSTVAVNLSDSAPFASLHKPGLSEQKLDQWKAAYRQGVAAQAKGDHAAAIKQFRAAAEIDDTYADLSFALAQCLQATGDLDEAAQRFAQARDDDALRFRCDARLNAAIRDIAAQRAGPHLRLADAEEAFADAADDGVPGRKFFYEHVHLRLAGAYLLARTIADQIEPLLPPSVRQDPDAAPQWLTADECSQRLAWTAWAHTLALNDMIARLADAPFTSQMNHAAQLGAMQREVEELRARVDAEAKDADAIFAPALAAAPNDSFLYSQLCQLHSQAGNAKAAVADARRATELLPTSVDHWMLLGAALATNREFEPAADAYRQALRIDEDNAYALLNLARLNIELQRRDDARAMYRRAIAANPHFGTAYIELGQILEEDGNLPAAIENYRLALANRVLRPQDLVQLAEVCESRGWMQDAAKNFLDAVAMRPADVPLRLRAGRCLVAARQFAAAQEQFRRAVELAPDSGEAHFLYAVELGRRQEYEDAIAHFREAARLMPDVAAPHINLAITFKRLGRRAEALEEFQQALALEPNNTIAQQNIAELTDTSAR